LSTEAQSIITMIRDLVQIPSRGGVDRPEPIVGFIEDWLGEHGLRSRVLSEQDGIVGVTCDVRGDPGPRYVLDACVDTAPFGDESEWAQAPTSGAVSGGWLYGRGSADSKAAIAIFCHIAAKFAQGQRLRGTLTLLFDADEHTGLFRGARNFFGHEAGRSDIQGVMIGYPGLSKIVTGGRGFLRAVVTVHGTAGHSGDIDPGVQDGNAVEKAGFIIEELRRLRCSITQPNADELLPTMSVTGVHGGEGWSTVPDTCQISVDIRLTSGFTAERARGQLAELLARADCERPTTRSTCVEFRESWPAYALPADSKLVVALGTAALRNGLAPRRGLVGPSNIGNYLASLGIEATAGFGVRYRNAHGTDEAIDLATIPVVKETYEAALRTLLA
jgi:succinyl-diaminopimelate desuccinylase